MGKYDLSFKLSVTRHYQLRIDGRRLTARRFGVSDSHVRKWVLAYEYHGLEGLTHRPISYTAEFKKSVIQHKHTHHLSAREVAQNSRFHPFLQFSYVKGSIMKAALPPRRVTQNSRYGSQHLYYQCKALQRPDKHVKKRKLSG